MKYITLAIILCISISVTEAKSKKGNKRKIRKLGQISTRLLKNIEANNHNINVRKTAYNPNQKFIKIDNKLNN